MARAHPRPTEKTAKELYANAVVCGFPDYAIFDSTGNLVESFEDEEPARAALGRIVEAEPEPAEHIALFVYSDDGMPVGDPVFARTASGVR